MDQEEDIENCITGYRRLIKRQTKNFGEPCSASSGRGNSSVRGRRFVGVTAFNQRDALMAERRHYAPEAAQPSMKLSYIKYTPLY